MDVIPQNFKGPNAAGTPKDFIPYYAYGHTSGNEQLTQPGPWAAGSLPYASGDQAAPTPPEPDHWAKFVFNQVDAGQTVTVYAYLDQYTPEPQTFVDWGDGTVEPLAPDEYGNQNHVYATGGRKTIYLTGSPEFVSELGIDKYIEGQFHGPSEMTLVSPYVIYLYIDSFPSILTVDCPAVDTIYFGDVYGNAVGRASVVNAVINSLPVVTTFFLQGGLDGALDLRNSTVNNFYYYNRLTPSVPAIYGGPNFNTVYIARIGGQMSIGALDFTSCTNMTYLTVTNGDTNIPFTVGSITGLNGKAYLSTLNTVGLAGLTTLNASGAGTVTGGNLYASNCPDLRTLNVSDTGLTVQQVSNDPMLSNINCNNNNSYHNMAILLEACAAFYVNNGTFTGTGNGVPVDQDAIDKATLISRGWTVITD